MWIFTPFGFFSIVSMRGNATHLLVRGRVRTDLSKLHEQLTDLDASGKLTSQIEANAGADYPYRFTVHRTLFANTLAHWIEKGLKYENFKNEVARFDPERVGIYHDVWAMLAREFADERPKPRIRVVFARPKERAKIVEIAADLAALQALVGGNLELVPMGHFPEFQRDRAFDGLHGYVHETGKLDGLAPNLRIADDVFVGPFVISKIGDEGDELGLSASEAEAARDAIDRLRGLT